MQTTWLHYIVDIIKQACENIWYYLHVVIIINNYYRKVSTKKMSSFLMLLAIQEMAHFLVSVIVITIIPLIVTTCNQTEIFVVNLVHYTIILSTELP